jgi:hypothetical protein
MARVAFVAVVAGLLCATAVAGSAAVFAPTQHAEAPPTFSDRTGDAGRWLDITGVDIQEESWGSLYFQVRFAGKVDWDEDGPLIALDLDRNPDTGSAYYGTEVEVAFEGGGNAREGEAVLYRASGWDFRRATPPEGWGWGLGPHEVDFFLDRSALGLKPDQGFDVVAATIGRHPDTAPDIGTFDYEPVAGTPPPQLGPDRRAPRVFAYDSSAVHGKAAKLGYWVLEGRGKTRQVIRVYRGRRRLAAISTPLAAASPFRLAHTVWRVPRGLRGRLRFSVRSVDAAGNRSRLAWASLVVR